MNDSTPPITEIEPTTDYKYIERKELISRLEGGETVVGSFATAALDISGYSEMQSANKTIEGESSTLAEQITQLSYELRNELKQRIENGQYGNALTYLKSAGDEFLIATSYKYITDFTYLTLFLLESQITFNELLEKEEFQGVKRFYQKKTELETPDDSAHLPTLLQMGVCIPDMPSTQTIAIKKAKSEEQEPFLVAGKGLLVKQIARKVEQEAQLAFIQANGETQEYPLGFLYSHILQKMYVSWGEDPFVDIKATRRVDYNKLETLCRKMRQTLAPVELSEEDLDTHFTSLGDGSETQNSLEVVKKEGAATYSKIEGFETVTVKISQMLEDEGIKKKEREAILAELTLALHESAIALAQQQLEPAGWKLKDTEYSPTGKHTRLPNGDMGKFHVTGAKLSMIHTLGIEEPENRPPEKNGSMRTRKESLRAMQSFVRAIRERDYKEKLSNQLENFFSQKFPQNNPCTTEFIKTIVGELDLKVRVGIADLAEDGVEAIVVKSNSDDKYIGGNAISQAARLAHIDIDNEDSFIAVSLGRPIKYFPRTLPRERPNDLHALYTEKTMPGSRIPKRELKGLGQRRVRVQVLQ